MGQDKDQGDEKHQFSKACHEQAYFGLPQGHKGLLAGDLYAGGEDTRHVDAHGPHRKVHKGGIAAENIGEHPGYGEEKNP